MFVYQCNETQSMNTITLIKKEVPTRFLAIVTAVSLILTAFPAAFFVAEAATLTVSPTDITVQENTEEISTVNASGHTNLSLSFAYDAEALDDADVFEYGWKRTSDPTKHPLGTINGANEGSAGDESGSESVSIDPSAAVSDLELYFTNTGTAADDDIIVSSISLSGDVVAPTEIIITNITELQNAIENQADGQTWKIQAGDYGLDRSISISVNGQTGWYFPIVVDDLTITGVGNPVIFGEEFSANGAHSSQNLVSVFGDNVTISDLTLMPKVEPNKTVEVMGEDFTIENVIFTPNTKVDESLYDGITNPQDREDLKEWGGSLYFSHEGDHVVKNVTINNGGVSFRYSPSGTDITFENVNIINETDVDWINAYRYSSGFNNSGNSIIGEPEVVYYVNATEANVASVFTSAQNGDTIELTSDITTSEQVTITRPITLKGNNHTVNVDFVKTGNDNNSAIGVINTDNVTIQNIILDGVGDAPWPQQLHGINVYESTGLILENITAKNFEGSGISINSSEVTASDISTENNAWHGINVDQRTSEPSKLTINETSQHTDMLHLYVDDVTKNVTIIDADDQYSTSSPGVFPGESTDRPNDLLYMLNSDDESPITTFTTPVDGAVASTTRVTGTIIDNQNVAQYSFIVSGSDSWNTRKWTPNLTPVLFDLNLCEEDRLNTCDENTLVDGEYKVRVAAYDGNGNRDISTNVSFILDTTGPKIDIKAGSQGSNDVFSEVSFKLFDKNKVDKLTLNGVEKDLSNNNWSDLNFVSPGKFGAVEGENTLIVYDVAGNSTTYVFTLFVDRDRPVFEVLEPVDGFIAYDDFEIKVHGTDNVGLGQFVVNLKDASGANLKPCLNESAGGVTDYTTSCTVDVDSLAPGFYGFKANARDLEGNISNTVSQTFEVREIVESIEILTPTTTEEVSGLYNFTALYIDADNTTDHIQWAVRAGSCDPNKGTVAGNVDGFSDGNSGYNFNIMLDTTDWLNGEYCFVVNPKEGPGEDDLRATQMFTVDNLEYGPYCGDGMMNQTWEMCEVGDANCTDMCTFANQCTDLQLAKITLDQNAPASESFDGQIYLGAATNIIPSGTWFNLGETGDASYIATANAVAGLAVERTADGKLALAFRGDNDSREIDYVQGTIETTNVDFGTVEREPNPSFKLENGNGSFLDVFDKNGSSIDFDLRVDTGNVGVTVEINEDSQMCLATLLITNPASDGDSITTDAYTFTAQYFDDDATTDTINWVIKPESCESNNTSVNLLGYGIAGYSPANYDPLTGQVSVTVDLSGLTNDNYCFVVNPQETGGESDTDRAIRLFTLDRSVDPDPETYTISGTKYEVLDSGNTPYTAGWTIYLTDGNTVTSTTTDASGNYSFEVAEGSWEVYEAVTGDWTQSDVMVTNGATSTEGGLESCVFNFSSGASDGDCDFYNEEEAAQSMFISQSSNSGGTRVFQSLRSATPMVLGASTSQCPFLNDFMQMEGQNDPFMVMKLQLFLSIFKDLFGGTDNPVTGVFDATTEQNVKTFQAFYSDQILDPWFELGIVPHNEPTGFVYKTTLWKINSIICPEDIALPDLEGETLEENVVIR